MISLVVAAAVLVAAGPDLLEAEGWPQQIKLASGPDLDGDGIPNDLHWVRNEVAVIISPGAGSWVPTWFKATAGIKFFGSPVVGTEREEIYSIGVQPPEGVIYVTIDNDDIDPDHGTTTIYRYPDGEIISAVVVLPRLCRDAHRLSVILHEVLHLRGLAHSGNPFDVMFPSSGSTKLSPKQLNWLRK